MAAPESRRFGKPSDPARPAASKSKTTRRLPRTTRRAGSEEGGEDKAAIVAAAKEEVRAKNQLVLIGGVGGGAFLLILIIAVAASSGSSGAARDAARRPERRAVAEPPPPPPPPPPKAHNYIRNVGAIVFVCGGSDKHQDREVVLSACPKCPSRNGFAWDEAASGYRCSSCKGVYENSSIKCDQCGRTPRVTHLKKSGPVQTP